MSASVFLALNVGLVLLAIIVIFIQFKKSQKSKSNYYTKMNNLEKERNEILDSMKNNTMKKYDMEDDDIQKQKNNGTTKRNGLKTQDNSTNQYKDSLYANQNNTANDLAISNAILNTTLNDGDDDDKTSYHSHSPSYSHDSSRSYSDSSYSSSSSSDSSSSSYSSSSYSSSDSSSSSSCD